MHLRTNSVCRAMAPKAYMKSYWLDDKRRRKLAVHWITWGMCVLHFTTYAIYDMPHIQIYTSYHRTRSDHFNYWSICVSLSCEIELILVLSAHTTYDEKCIKYAWNGNDGYKFARSLNYDGWMCRHTCVLLQIKYVKKDFSLLLAYTSRYGLERNASK